MSDINLTDNSGAAKEAIMEALRNGLQDIGDQAVGYAMGLCPTDTGRLHDSIDNTVSGDAVYIGTNVEYGEYVETNGKAHHESGEAHFLKRAASDHADEYVRILETELKTVH